MSKMSNLRSLSFVILIVLAGLACALPGRTTPTPVPATGESGAGPEPAIPAGAEPTPRPLPVALVEVDPPPGSELGLTAPITFIFNQPIDRDSFAAALNGQPTLAGKFNWTDDRTVSFLTDSPYPPSASLTLQLDSTRIRSLNDTTMLGPVEIQYNTAGYLRLTEALPSPGTTEVDPTAAIVTTFNRPVVPLGQARPSEPPAFVISPEVQGTGEWINSATYVFYPEPALEGGVLYQVVLNEGLQSTAGSPLDPAQPPALEWEFSTAVPELLEWSPGPGAIDVPLDPEIRLTFNQPIDPDSFEAGFQLLNPDGIPVDGEQAWEEEARSLVFRPAEPLARNQEYRLFLGEGIRSAGGSSLAGQLDSSFRTVGDLSVLSFEPGPGGLLSQFASPVLYLNAPPDPDSFEAGIAISPPLQDFSPNWDPVNNALWLTGQYQPEESYAISLSSGLVDRWGQPLGQPATYRFQTAALQPTLRLSWNPGILYIDAADQRIPLQVTNLSRLDLSLGRLPLADLIRILGPGGNEILQSYQPPSQFEWRVNTQAPRNQNHRLTVDISPRGDLSPGLYVLRLSASELTFQPQPILLVVSRAHLTVKAGPLDALVWAVDLRTLSPLDGARVRLINEAGQPVAEGRADSDGIFQSAIPQREEDFEPLIAVVGEIGSDDFSLALPGWDGGVSPWDLGVSYAFTPPRQQAYLYTDRPIYRPGQTVYYRGVLRWNFDGRYRLPELESIKVDLFQSEGRIAGSQIQSVSDLGTIHGEFQLDGAASPGWYRLETAFGTVPFQVAEFRKPEIDLALAIEPSAVTAGEDIRAQVDGRFFFGGPAANAQISWQWFAQPSNFYLPGYQVGETAAQAYQFPWPPFAQPFGELVLSGTSSTDADGRLDLVLPTRPESLKTEYTLEATLTDQSGFPVSARQSVVVHPADVYIGIRPSAWVGRSGEPIQLDVQVVGWDGSPMGDLVLEAVFQSVEWVPQESVEPSPFGFPALIPEYTLVASDSAQANTDGRYTFVFTPPGPGTYRFAVRNGRASTDTLIWVAGPGQGSWPSLPNQAVQLTADQESYRPGDQAEVFIPNPFLSEAKALITVERSRILRTYVLELSGSGSSLSIPLTQDDAPNVYVSAVLLGRDETGQPDFRIGVLDLAVQPAQQILQVAIGLEPEQAAPGDTVSLEIRVTDSLGVPVQGEFSVSVVDLATLSLAEPTAPGIRSAFYGEQPLGVRTGVSLANDAMRTVNVPGGLGGGGGGDAPPPVREDFEDTAFWQADLLTDSEGRAEAAFELPDNLTSWQVEVRGVNSQTQVGEGEAVIVATKPLLIRPVTPRFLVAGDRIELAAIVHNNTDETVAATVSIQETGLALADPAQAMREVLLSPHSQSRVSWWGDVESVEVLDLLFRVEGGGFSDAARPPGAVIPVLQYSAPQTSVSTGVLSEPGEHLELVSVAHSFQPTGGKLSVGLSPSLAAVALESLSAPDEDRARSTEAIVSDMISWLAVGQVFDEIAQDPPGLQSQAEAIVRSSIRHLEAAQNEDGGWSWWPGPDRTALSDPFISAYALIGLSNLQDAGILVPEEMLAGASDFVQATVFTPQLATQTWQFNRLAFQHYALVRAGKGDPLGLAALYEIRALIGPWGRAFLGLALDAASPGDTRAKTLIADLSTEATRTGSGAYWPLEEAEPRNMATTLLNTSAAAHAIAVRDPASPILLEAVRYFVSTRQADGSWGSSFETAWARQALLAVLRGTGELGASFSFGAALNGSPLAQEALNGDLVVAPVSVEVPLQDLFPTSPNELRIHRNEGSGRLYYLVHFRQDLPVELASAYQRGIAVDRVYYSTAEDCRAGACTPIRSAAAGETITVRLTITLAEDVYYLHVEDHFPAGAEILDLNLETSRLGSAETLFDLRDPFSQGYGWWFFSDPQIYDEAVIWSADFVPAGTYELEYQLVLLQAGEFQVLPAVAGPVYFPEIVGQSPGAVFEIHAPEIPEPGS